jgi:hypothetical protein
MYRYWTGTSWTEAITANPQGTPPPTTQPIRGGYGAGGYGPGSGASGQGSYVPGSYGQGTDPYGSTKKKSNLGWWVGGLAVLVAVAVALFLIIRALTGVGPGPILPDLPGGPSATVTPNICPPAASGSTLPTATNQRPGWVSGGKLAYPALGDPWQDAVDNRVPWGALASEQMVVDQPDYDGEGHDWVSSIIVSDLFVGDGFASTKVAAETVLKCVLGTYYADTVVTPNEISSAQHNVDGHPGWLIETQLSFTVPGLNAKGERVLLLVVQTGDDDYSLFYASVPDTRDYLVPDARKALDGLQVG